MYFLNHRQTIHQFYSCVNSFIINKIWFIIIKTNLVFKNGKHQNCLCFNLITSSYSSHVSYWNSIYVKLWNLITLTYLIFYIFEKWYFLKMFLYCCTFFLGEIRTLKKEDILKNWKKKLIRILQICINIYLIGKC